MVVDALDLCYTKSHVDTFVIISGDSDFSPLVSKLRENNKTVIGVGVKNSTSDLLIANCDEFIFYDDLVREQRRKATTPRKAAAKTAAKAPARGKGSRKGEARGEAAPAAGAEGAAEAAVEAAAATPAEAPGEGPAAEGGDEARRQKAIDEVLETLEALLAERGGDDVVWGSMVKQALKRRQPGFNESYYGFRSFNALLQEAQARGLVALTHDDKSGGFKVRLATPID
jgi:hypothetical protein